MASHGFVLEASSLVSIYISLVLSIHSKKSHFMLPTDVSRSHVYPSLLLQSAGVCGFRPFWVSCPSNRGLETREMVQPTIGPADPGGDAAVSHQRANPTTSPTDRLLPRAICQDNCSSGPICLQQPCSPGGHPKGPSLESGQSSTGGRLTEAGPWWWIQGHPSGRFICVWQG